MVIEDKNASEVSTELYFVRLLVMSIAKSFSPVSCCGLLSFFKRHLLAILINFDIVQKDI